MSGNKIKYGLKNVHYAVITNNNGTITFGTPVAIPGAVNLALSAAGEKFEFYADDVAYFVGNSNNGYEGDLEIALIPDSFRTDVLGEEVDSNGALIENANVFTKDFALMFEFSGDALANRHVMYNVNTTRPNVEGATKGKTIEAQTETLSMIASPAIDTGDVKAKLKPTDTGYDTFFSAVYLKNAISNTIAVDEATFSKAAPADVTIDVTSTGAPTVKDVKIDGSSIGGANITIAGVDVTIESAYMANLTNGIYIVSVEYTGGNAVEFILTVTA